MSSLTTNNITINKITSSNGKFSGDNASGRIELTFVGNTSFAHPSEVTLPLDFFIEENGFVKILVKSSMSGDEELEFKGTISSPMLGTFLSVDKIIITGSKISGINKKAEQIPIGDDGTGSITPKINLKERAFIIESFQFPKDSPEEIDCENIFANWNLQGELPELDDRISNLNGAFANTQISGKLPKLPKNLKYASNAFLNCSSLTGVSKDLLSQHVTAQKPYIKYQTSDSMVSGCQKSVTSWFSVDNGGDHDNIEYTEWTSSRNATGTDFPYIKLTLPRALKDKHSIRCVYKNYERIGQNSNCLYCCRSVTGKGTAAFISLNGLNTSRIDSDTTQHTIPAKSNVLDNRLTDFQLLERYADLNELNIFKLFSEDLEKFSMAFSSGSTTGVKLLTMFVASVNGAYLTHPGKMAIAELDIWDDEGYLIKMRSQGTSMKDLVSGTTYSSASTTQFTTLPVEIRDVDKEDLLFWEKFSGKTLPLNFWDEYSIALAEYKANPTKTEEWTVQFDKPTSTFTSNCPYFDVAPTKPVINLFLTKVAGFYPSYNTADGKHISPRAPFHSSTNQLMYFPNAVNTNHIVSMVSSLDVAPIIPLGTYCGGMSKANTNMYVWLKNVTGASGIIASSRPKSMSLYVPKAEHLNSLMSYGFLSPYYLTDVYIKAPKAFDLNSCMGLNYTYQAYVDIKLDIDIDAVLYANKFCYATGGNSKTSPFLLTINGDKSGEIRFNNCTTIQEFMMDRGGFNQPVIVPSCSSATNAFLNTGMTARNIAKTLNSLPKWTDGKTHTITFTGCPGIEWKETTETFNGVANCPLFTKDTEGKALRKAFAKAVTNGWTVEIGTATNAASTMSLRILQYYKKTESECGDYVDSEGKTYIISTGDAFGPGGKNQDYEQFSSLEECLESWNLTEVVREEPVPLEEFIEEEQLDELENGTENFEEIASENDAS